MKLLCAAPDDERETQTNKIYLGEITRVEVAAALTQKAIRTKEVSRENALDSYKLFLNDFERDYGVVVLTSPLIRSAADLAQKHVLRAYDAIQLSLALDVTLVLKESNLDLTFVSGDQKLLLAARAEGLATENPHDHADSD